MIKPAYKLIFLSTAINENGRSGSSLESGNEGLNKLTYKLSPIDINTIEATTSIKQMLLISSGIKRTSAGLDIFTFSPP